MMLSMSKCNRRAVPGCNNFDSVESIYLFNFLIFHDKICNIYETYVYKLLPKKKSARLIERQEFYSASPQTF